MLTVTIHDADFHADLRRLQQRLGDLREPMEEVGNALETAARERFETRTDPSGAHWAPWAETTRAGYPFLGTAAAAGPDGPARGNLLDRYGAMLDSLSFDADRMSVRVGFGLPYAAYHEWGTRKMERRGLLTANPDTGELGVDDEDSVLAILEDWLNGAVD